MINLKKYNILKDGLVSITWLIIMIITFKLLKMIYKIFA